METDAAAVPHPSVEPPGPPFPALTRPPATTAPHAAQTPPPATKPPPAREHQASAPASGSSTLRQRASPAARRRARGLQVALDIVAGSGLGGAITVADVERAHGARATAAQALDAARLPARAFDPAAMRLAIAGAMARSKREIPHYYLSEPVPMGRALDWLRAHNETVPVTQRLLPAALLIKAVARALRAVPGLNGHHIDGTFRPASTVHAGVAIRLRGGGLIAPALRDAQDQPLPQLMAALASLVQRARSGGLRSSELTDPTVTVTALGEQGAATVFGVIHPPQVALVGFGRVQERAWVDAGRVVAIPVVEASLSADHRASDGLTGSAFLAELSAQLQQPEAL